MTKRERKYHAFHKAMRNGAKIFWSDKANYDGSPMRNYMLDEIGVWK